MSFLYPIFLAGMALVGLPILLHLIRRYTRQQVTFSSLMFLHASAPRFQRRRQLQNLPLLILRCLIICLLALAFARPFFGQPTVNARAPGGRRLVLLLDTSASMRRSGLWEQAVQTARDLLAEAGPRDSVCLQRFGRSSRTVIDFEQWRSLPPDQRVTTVFKELSGMHPTWEDTHLDQALIRAVEALEEDMASAGADLPGSGHILLISDLQQGSTLDNLQAFVWPPNVSLTIKPILPAQPTNAAPQWVASRATLSPGAVDIRPNIRVANSAHATAEAFQLHWEAADGAAGVTEVYVAPGRSTLAGAALSTDPNLAQVVTLTGDAHDFDNRLYIAPALRSTIDILYLGQDPPHDIQGLHYYLRHAYQSNERFQVHVTAHPGNAVLDPNRLNRAHLVVVSDRLAPENLDALHRALEQGQKVWVIGDGPETDDVLRGLSGVADLSGDKVSVSGYAMLERLDYTHPLLAPFSEPHLGDFTRIHVWSYRRLDPRQLPRARVLAWFESRDPAWLEIDVGKGTLLIWTLSWKPASSDLALSSKFVPLLHSILEYGSALLAQEAQYTVGDVVSVSTRTVTSAHAVEIVKPDQTTVRLTSDFTATDVPGLYHLASAHEQRTFAVNLSSRESRTAPMQDGTLEKLGVRLEASPLQTPVASAAVARQQQRAQVEASQRVWHKLLVGAFIVLLLEIGLGGWLARRAPESQGEPA
jgi:hypothetical protein